MSNVSFRESIRIAPDNEKEMLLKIQEKIEKNGITVENVLRFTKDLSDSQKNQLKQLYREQIYGLNSSIRNYKQRILRIKENM